MSVLYLGLKQFLHAVTLLAFSQNQDRKVHIQVLRRIVDAGQVFTH